LVKIDGQKNNVIVYRNVNTLGGIAMIAWLWKSMKMWRGINFGPVRLTYRFDRRVRVIATARSRAQLLARSRPQRHYSQPKPLEQAASVRKIALIVGVGPGFGNALAHRLADDGFEVILASRNADRLAPLAQEIRAHGGIAHVCGCDATLESSVLDLFKMIAERHGIPALVVYSLQNFGPGDAVDIELPAFEDGLKHNCVGSFLIARSAARLMLPKAEGTIILVGSTSSMIGRAGHLNLAVGKFGQRALAQVLARELWPRGIHVAHVVIDADISEGDQSPLPQADPHHIAHTIMSIYAQPKSAWTSEVDIRPWNEAFWMHC
jgi:NAD(P)-dependent dehydrogenase (short-subunit alcohol dehydrogenase family)